MWRRGSALVWGTSGRWFKSSHPDSTLSKQIVANMLLQQLENNLNARINPEVSRRFDIKHLEQSQIILKEATKRIQQYFLTSQKKDAKIIAPPSQLQRISIVGSNGKGSTAFYLAMLAQKNALKNIIKKNSPVTCVGLYTSPHLENVLERIRLRKLITRMKGTPTLISTVPIPIQVAESIEGMDALQKIIPEYYEQLSYFEILTVLAYYLFQKETCALQIYEAGLGGRWDATRMVQAQSVVLTIITNEHTQILGDSPEAILKEKLGILSSHTQHLFCMPQPLLSYETISEEARRIAPQLQIHLYEPQRFKAKHNYLHDNYAFACFILKALRLLKDNPCITYDKFIIPGRLERHSIQNPNHIEIIFDVAHNPDAIERCLQDITPMKNEKEGTHTLFILALLKERPLSSCLDIVHKAGFENIWYFYGEQWADYNSMEQLSGSLNKINAVTEDELLPKLKKELKNTYYKRIIFCGSHRSYVYFRKLCMW